MNSIRPATHAWFQGLLPDARSDILANLVAGVADLAILVRQDGTIADMRARDDIIAGATVADRIAGPLSTLLTSESVPKLDRCLTSLRDGAAELPTTELNLRLPDRGGDLPVSFSFHRIGTDEDVLMLGRDLRPIAEIQQQLITAQIALEADYEAQRDTQTRLRVLMSVTPDAYLFVNVARREITEANAAAAQLFALSGPAAVEGPIERVLKAVDDGDLTDLLVEMSNRTDDSLRATLRRDGSEVDVSALSFRIPGAHMILCRVVQVETAQARDEIGERLAAFYAASPEAIVFCGGDGRILNANEGFLDLVESPQEKDVRGRSLGDFLSRGNVDLSALLANAGRAGALRLFTTRISAAPGQSKPVEISVTRIKSGVRSIFALVLRDTSRTTAPRAEASDPAVDMDSIAALIGKQSLKDIVAQATDVIERMCIDAAVELTSNNRVAAADMLGLSRQSLYVKLRKYDLLKRDSAGDA